MRPSEWVRDFKALRDFRAFEIVDVFRLSLSLGAFKLLVVFATVSGSIIAGSTFWFVLDLLRNTVLQDHPDLAWQLCSLAVLYGSAVLIGSETLTGRRLTVAANPHLRLFRDLDLPLSQVMLRYGVLPAVLGSMPLVGATVIFLAVFSPGNGARAVTYAWLLPVAVCAASAASLCSAHYASRPPYLRSSGRLQAASCAVGGLLLGVVTTATLRAHVTPPVPPTVLAPVTAVVLVVAAMGFAALSTQST